MAIYIKYRVLGPTLINRNMDIMVRKTANNTPTTSVGGPTFWQKGEVIDGVIKDSTVSGKNVRFTLIPKFRAANAPDLDYVILRGHFCLNDGTPFNGHCVVSAGSTNFEFDVVAGNIGGSHGEVHIPLELVNTLSDWTFYPESNSNYWYDSSMIPFMDFPIGVRPGDSLGAYDPDFVGGDELEANYVIVNNEIPRGCEFSVEVMVDDDGRGWGYRLLAMLYTNVFMGDAGDGIWDPRAGNSMEDYFGAFMEAGTTIPQGYPFGDSKIWTFEGSLPTILINDDLYSDMKTVVHLPVVQGGANIALEYKFDQSDYTFRCKNAYFIE